MNLQMPKTTKYICFYVINCFCWLIQSIHITYIIYLFETTTLIALKTITLPNPSQTSTILEWNLHEVAEFNCLQSVTFMAYLSKDWHFVTDTDILTSFTHWHSICVVYLRLINLEFNQSIGWKKSHERFAVWTKFCQCLKVL